MLRSYVHMIDGFCKLYLTVRPTYSLLISMFNHTSSSSTSRSLLYLIFQAVRMAVPSVSVVLRMPHRSHRTNAQVHHEFVRAIIVTKCSYRRSRAWGATLSAIIGLFSVRPTSCPSQTQTFSLLSPRRHSRFRVAGCSRY